MALAATTVYECNTSATASNVNGGGFNPSNANMMTDLTTDANTANTSAPVVSSASYNFTATDVNHWLYIQSGTSWTAGWYKIASVASNKATLSAAVGSANVVQVVNNLYRTNTVIGCATVGTPTGGVFTIDYSQSTASPFASTDIAVVTTTTLTSAANPFTKAMVGNLIHITAGTAAAGWYEIVSVAVVTATIDRSATTTGTGNTGKVGGALSLASSDDAVFELSTNSATSAARFFIKSGSYTIGGAISNSQTGSTTWPIIIEGYSSQRGDRPLPSSGNQPIFVLGANAWTMGQATNTISIEFTTTTASGVVTGGKSQIVNCKVRNTSTTASRVAISPGDSDFAIGCEAISYRGRGIVAISPTFINLIANNWVHDCDRGIPLPTGATIVCGNIVSGCVTSAVSYASSNTAVYPLFGNTLYGAENKLGLGINIIATIPAMMSIRNNNIYGFTTGISSATANAVLVSGYNNFYNNTADTTSGKFFQDSTDTLVNPSFTNVTQITGSTATTTAGQHLVQTGATFQTSGVVAGTHYVYLVSGTGVTVGIYGITSVDSETQITLDLDPTANATGDKVWQITLGNNFAVGTNLKATGWPGPFPGGKTTGYTDIGAVQRQEAAASSGGGTKAYTFA